MNTIHTIEVKYLGATNFKGARVKMTSLRFNDSKTISYSYSHNTSYEDAKDWLESEGFNVLYVSEGKSCYYLHTDTFKSLRGE